MNMAFLVAGVILVLHGNMYSGVLCIVLSALVRRNEVEDDHDRS